MADEHKEYIAVESHYFGHKRDINDLDLKQFVEDNSSPGGGGVESVVAGSGVNVDNTDPANPVVSATGGSSYLIKTYAELVALINADGLVPGTLYKISDRGDRGLFFTAISVNELAKDGTRLMLCPARYSKNETVGGNTWIGVWNLNKAQKQIDSVSLSGTSGTANISGAGGLTKLATFNSDLDTTAADFVSSWAADYLALGIVVTSNASDIIFTAEMAGIPFTSPSIANVSGDLDGSINNVQANISIATDGLTIWGGLVWKNLTGGVGTVVDDISLDTTNWLVIPKASFNNSEYVELELGCQFDVANDWIERQWDAKGNIVGLDFESYQWWDGTAGTNYCDMTDWNFDSNNDDNVMFDNVTMIVSNNSCDSIYSNRCPAGIWGNSNGGDISSNRNGGSINENSNGGKIDRNTNIGSISGNTNTTSIKDNSNGGNITNNSNLGTISKNSNNGNIESNSTQESIQDNSNVGNISSNSNTSIINNNTNAGSITGNTNTGTISINNNAGNISTNSCHGNINNNINGEHISSNSNTGGINNNNSAGTITSNSNAGEIVFNSSNGDIDSNSNNGNINFNSNGGSILNIGSANDDIIHNTNNGDISTTTTGDISDPVVNK